MPRLTLSGAGCSIWWERRGAGPWLVLLNGMSQTTASHGSQVRFFEKRYSVLTWDARGQGQSEIGPLPISLDDHVADLIELLDHVGAERVALAGFSHGARVALAAAARHPRHVDRLVLTSIGSGESALRRMWIRSWLEVLHRGGLEAMAWASLPAIVGDSFAAAHERDLDSVVRATVRRNSPEGMRALLAGSLAYRPALEDGPLVRCPTLLATSDEDPLVPISAAAALAEAIPNCRHERFTAAGHTIPIEAAERWRSAVDAFLCHTAE